MARGKDKQPRKRKASRSEPVWIEDDEYTNDNGVEKDVPTDSGSDSDGEDTDMDE